MKKSGSKIFSLLVTGVFISLCAFFSLGMLLPGATDAAAGGKRPALFTENGISPDWRDEFETWFSKHFAYRDKWVDVFSLLKEKVFSTGGAQVLVGSDGFLFFADTTDDYTGASPMTEDELRAAADALLHMKDYAEAHGAKFLFLCAPNKNTIYSEKMPKTVPHGDAPSNLDRLLPLLAERGVPAADLREALRTAAESKLIYHKRDSHWNAEGARIAALHAERLLGRDTPAFLETPLTSLRHDFPGDLDALLYPGRTRLDDDYVVPFEDGFRTEGAYRTPMDMRIETSSDAASGSLLLFRDSFANALLPFFGCAYERTVFSRGNPYRFDWLEEDPFDVVIVEIAERNLPDLIGSDLRIIRGK